MRLRQAVLHPQLVLKRLAQNLAEKKHAKARTQDDLDGDLDEEAIKKLLNSYSGTDGKEGSQAEGGAYQSQVLQALLDGEEEEDECVICFEAVTSPVLLPKCLHKGCRDCIVALLGQYEERGEDVCSIDFLLPVPSAYHSSPSVSLPDLQHWSYRHRGSDDRSKGEETLPSQKINVHHLQSPLL